MAILSISITESTEPDLTVSYAIQDPDAARIIAAHCALLGAATPLEGMQQIAERTISELVQRAKQWEIEQAKLIAEQSVAPIALEPVV
jgi:hypothetical protein